MAQITPAKLAHSLMQVHIQTELNQSDIEVMYHEESENYINHIEFLYKPLNTTMIAERVMGPQWNVSPLYED